MFHIWREGTGQCANLKQSFCLFALHRCTVQKSVTSGTCLQALSCFAEVNIANESTKKRKRIDGEGPFARVTISVFRCLLSQIFPPPPLPYCAGDSAKNAYVRNCPAHVFCLLCAYHVVYGRGCHRVQLVKEHNYNIQLWCLASLPSI